MASNDDEPIEDVQAVGMTAAATAARVLEIAARAAQDQRAQRDTRTPTERAHDHIVVSSLNRERDNVLAEAKAWAEQSNPEALKRWSAEHTYAETRDGHDSADRALLSEWTKAQEYDSPNRRQRTEQELAHAGVPAEASHARIKSDLMNGTDPALAAAQGSSIKTQQRKTQPAPERIRTR